MKLHTAILCAALGLPLAPGHPVSGAELDALPNRPVDARPVDSGSGDARSVGNPLDDDLAGIEAIALYPEPVRDAILEASIQPALIVKLSRLQAASSATFRDLLADYPRHTQEAVWDLVRFPGLVTRLAEGGPRSAAQLEQIAADFPPEIRRTIAEYGGRHRELLGQVADLNRQTEADAAQVLAGHPAAVRDSFDRLLLHPEVLAILAQDISSTVLLGEAYRAQPRQVRDRAAQLHLELAQQHARALAEGSPDTPGTPATPTYSGDYAEVARTYAERYAYEGAAADASGDTRVRVTYHTYPYPYWFGYPRWYAGPAWGVSMGWYLTPGLSARIGFHPYAYYRLAAPRYHHNAWARRRYVPRRPRHRPRP